ncbi:hypothetical protein ACROYT_G030245 [Oculina patagonica]
MNHTIQILLVKSLDDCEYLCYLNDTCVSLNIKNKDPNSEKHECELNNSTHMEHDGDLIADTSYYYRGAKNSCGKSRWLCENNATCQSGFTDKGYRCLCTPGFWGEHCEKVFANCADRYQFGERNSGVYSINPDGSGGFDVFCDQTTAGGGWTVFQKRVDGSVNFYRGWADYKHGFGYLNGEFWLGFDKINRLTSSGRYMLRVDLDIDGNTVYAEYDSFAIGSEATRYQLSVGNYLTTGTARDSLTFHNGSQFTTKDQDNDLNADGNCAIKNKGAWWYKNCHKSNLNGAYHSERYREGDSIRWEEYSHTSATRAEMKIRPVDF